MIRMFVRHEVADYDAWREVYDGFDRGALGVVSAAVYRSIDDPNDITVVHDFESAESAHAFVDASDLESAMRDAGVTSTPTIWFTTPG